LSEREEKKMKRENLAQSIFGVLNRWPELERCIFSRAHYNGQSVNDIAHILQLDVEEVRTILRHCDRRLYASLDTFRKSDCERLPIVMAEVACPAVRGEDFNGAYALAFKLKSIHDISQTAV
jgi:DNA-directed RNA polymerase specialized sigma subunit